MNAEAQEDADLSSLLLKMEKQLMDPAFRRDREAVSSLLAEDFREFGSSGRFLSRESTLELLETEESYITPTIRDFAMQRISAEAVLVTYRTVRSDPPRVTLRSSLWVVREGKWQMLFHQGSKSDQPRPYPVTDGIHIDWEALAKQIGGIDFRGDDLIVGTEGGRRGLELLIGEGNISSAVDHFVSRMPGAFTVEMVLRIIHSTVAMERCYEIYKKELDRHLAGSAIFLLREIADERVLPWVREFLDDEDEGVRFNGVDVLRWLLFGLVSDDGVEVIAGLLDKADSDPSPEIRRRAGEIRIQLAHYCEHN